MEKKNIPSNLGISEPMKEAYVKLGKKTPFSKWANARLWDAIERENYNEKRDQEVDDNGSDK